MSAQKPLHITKTKPIKANKDEKQYTIKTTEPKLLIFLLSKIKQFLYMTQIL